MFRTKSYTEEEIDEIVASMPDERLCANYERALESPGTSDRLWGKLLGAEMRRRGLTLDAS